MTSPTAERLTALLADPDWQPTRAHIEEARNALTLNAATIEEQQDEIDRLREVGEDWRRELIRLRPPQAGMVYAAASYAGVTGELTVEQYEITASHLREDISTRGDSWHEMAERLAAKLGIEFAHAEKPKKEKKRKPETEPA